MEFVYALGQTPIDPDEAAGLIPKHIVTQAQLNEWEEVNIFAGQKWGMRESKKRTILEEAFVRDLHKRMFNKTWAWAGTFRNTDRDQMRGKPRPSQLAAQQLGGEAA